MVYIVGLAMFIAIHLYLVVSKMIASFFPDRRFGFSSGNIFFFFLLISSISSSWTLLVCWWYQRAGLKRFPRVHHGQVSFTLSDEQDISIFSGTIYTGLGGSSRRMISNPPLATL